MRIAVVSVGVPLAVAGVCAAAPLYVTWGVADVTYSRIRQSIHRRRYRRQEARRRQEVGLLIKVGRVGENLTHRPLKLS